MIEVGRLTLEESVDIIVSRAAQFPPVLIYYCHARSGGLPRDLLRVARRCVEIHTEGEPVATAAMIERIVHTDLRRLIDGLLETIEDEAHGALAWSMRERLTAEAHPPDVVGFITAFDPKARLAIDCSTRRLRDSVLVCTWLSWPVGRHQEP